jgi:hypothetical protein
MLAICYQVVNAYETNEYTFTHRLSFLGQTNGKEKTSVHECFFYYRIGTIKKRGTERIDKKVIIFIRQKV